MPQTLVLYIHRSEDEEDYVVMHVTYCPPWSSEYKATPSSIQYFKWSLKMFFGDHWGQIEIMATAEGARNIRQPQVPIQYFHGGFPNGP